MTQTQNLPTFVHLRVHSAYSLAQGAIKIKDLVDLAKMHNMPALGLCDTNNLFGALEYAMACASKGVQPIIGAQLNLFHSNLTTPFVLIAQSEIGYKNLLAIVSKSHLSGHRYNTIQDFKEHHGGLVALTGGFQGLVGQLILNEQEEDAENFLKELKELFEDRLYIELTRLGYPEEIKTEPTFLQLAQKLSLPIVATNDVFFKEKDLHEAHDVLICVAAGRYLSELDRPRYSEEHYFKSQKEMEELFQDLPEALENSVLIARRCHFMPEPHNPMLPPFITASGRSEDEELIEQANQGLKDRLKGQDIDPTPYEERLNYEIGIIQKMGFSGYFLIVSDFIKWAKSQGIPVGPGRGSGAGSLVAWSLSITDMDPIRFQLIFERFLNPERVSMPDFDVDFCQERRDEVIDYVRRRYGDDKVAHIITFGKLQARAVLRDVGRVLQIPYGQVDKICKMIPNNPANPVTLAQALEMDPALNDIRYAEPTNEKLMDIAIKLEGLYRHASTHAAGVVIGGAPLVETIPLYKDDKSELPVTQFSMKYVETAGLLKFDFLGLKTLTVIEHTCKLIREKIPSFNISDVSLEDKNTFELLCRVETVGVFQLESQGMRDVLKKLKPDRLEDLIALVSLYRPGPMDDIPRYLACKHGLEPVTYLHPDMEPILGPTYGVMVYQEQVMKTAQVLAGYSLGGADLLRRAMGKKIKAEMDTQRDIFLKGCKSNNIEESLANEIFDQMAKFAGYGFNKSHAAPYALLTYQTAFLKANYTHEFFASSMTLDSQNTDKINVYREDLKNYNIPLLPPDINKSTVFFTVEENGEEKGIRYALAALKNVGEHAMETLVAERAKNGPFKNLDDFAKRIDPKHINKRQLESLIAAGALDSIHSDRPQLYNQADSLMKQIQSIHHSSKSGQGSLFGALSGPTISLTPSKPWTTTEKLQKEYDSLGFFLSAHPLDVYRELFKTLSAVNSNDLSHLPDQEIKIPGILLNKQERLSKAGHKFAFLQFSDAQGVFETVVFPELLLTLREALIVGQAFLLRATLRQQEEGYRLLTQGVSLLDDLMQNQWDQITIHVDERFNPKHLKELLVHQGGVRVIIKTKIDPGDKLSILLKDKYKVDTNIYEHLQQLPGVLQLDSHKDEIGQRG